MRLTSLTGSSSTVVAVSVLVAACGSSPPPPAAARPKIADAPKKRADPPKDVVCTGSVDVADLFARHAKAYGSEADVARSLPITMSGTVIVSGKVGKYEESLDAKRLKSAIHLKGLERASGVDENGTWQLGNSGGVARVRANETRTTDEWILRRHYLSQFDVGRGDVAVCQVGEGKRRIILEEKIAELGRPRLVFDADTTELLGSEFQSVDGHMSTRTVSWGPRQPGGASWPARSSGVTEGESTIELTTEQITPAAADAFAVSAPFLDVTWPKSETVKVPMKLYGGEILLDVTLGGKKVRALLDSGAGVSVIEANGKTADAFTPELEFEGQSASQTITFGLGKLADVTVAGLVVKNIPAARVPIPTFDQFGPNRPDLVLGWSLFENNGVRIDYAKNELVFARDASKLHAPNAPSIDFRDVGDKVIASAELGGKEPAFLQIDTGNGSSISLNERWAKKHGVPGPTAQVASLSGQFSAGTDTTTSRLFRGSYAIGPLSDANAFLDVAEGPDTGIIAGLVGNLVLAKCHAVVFDVPQRKIWLDGPCDRKPAENHGWWTLTRRDDPAAKDHPWLVASIAEHGSASAAGVLPGDRLIAIDGKPVGLAFDLMGTFMRPLGTKIALTVLRGSETKKLNMTLIDPL